VQSGVYRYLEFKSVEGLLVRSLAGPLLPVPHSRAEVFASRLSLKEKHALMQCLKSSSEPASVPLPPLFVDWLRARGLTDELQRAVLYGVCRLPSPAAASSCPCEEGLIRMRAHIASVGRFGSVSPLLFPLYGTSELAQAFCRLAAVRGAVYVLKRAPTHLCLDSSGRCAGVVAAGQRLQAPVVVLPADALPERLLAPTSSYVARGICVTTAPLVADLPPCSLAVMPPTAAGNLGSVVHVLQLDSSMSVCPKSHCKRETQLLSHLF
jgi:Rab proteins geranylgeranyltransferase component A